MSSADHTRLRVLMVNSGLGYGGAETQLIAMARELQRRGHEVAVYLLTKDAPRAAELRQLGIPVLIASKRSRLDFRVIRHLRRFMREWQPQLVHGFLFDANIYVRLAAIGTGIPVLNSERSHGYQLSMAQRAVHMPTRWLVDAVVANTFAGRDFAQAMYGFGPDKCFAVWNGVDLDEIDSRRAACRTDYRQEFFGTPNLKMAVLVGTIKPAKDHLLAIEVAERLIDAGHGEWGVAFVGAAYGERLGYASVGEQESNVLAAQVVERLRNSRHKERIRLVGRRDDALEIISSADVLYCTSRNEGFPNVVLEAMAVGTPVVSTNYSDISLILEDPAWVVMSRDPAEMAGRMLVVAGVRSEIAKRLRGWVEAKATVQRCVDRLQLVYFSVLKVTRAV